MAKTKRQKRFRFNHDKKARTLENDLQVSRFISEGSPDTQQEINENAWDSYTKFNEMQDHNRDGKLVDNIERAIEKEAFLSSVRDNIQIMANSGVVTLEGIVFTEEEKNVAGEMAAAFVGSNNINNNLEVTTSNLEH